MYLHFTSPVCTFIDIAPTNVTSANVHCDICECKFCISHYIFKNPALSIAVPYGSRVCQLKMKYCHCAPNAIILNTGQILAVCVAVQEEGTELDCRKGVLLHC